MPTTEITRKLGILIPIIQAPMAGSITTPEFVAAVSNAGGLGSFGAGYMNPHDLRRGITKIRSLTNKPFAVNLFIPEEHDASPEEIQKTCMIIEQACHELQINIPSASKPFSVSFAEQMNVIVEERVPVFSFTFGTLRSQWITKLKRNKSILIGTATNVAEAKCLQEAGVDMVVAQGCEAGGGIEVLLLERQVIR